MQGRKSQSHRESVERWTGSGAPAVTRPTGTAGTGKIHSEAHSSQATDHGHCWGQGSCWPALVPAASAAPPKWELDVTQLVTNANGVSDGSAQGFDIKIDEQGPEQHLVAVPVRRRHRHARVRRARRGPAARRPLSSSLQLRGAEQGRLVHGPRGVQRHAEPQQPVPDHVRDQHDGHRRRRQQQPRRLPPVRPGRDGHPRKRRQQGRQVDPHERRQPPQHPGRQPRSTSRRRSWTCSASTSRRASPTARA